MTPCQKLLKKEGTASARRIESMQHSSSLWGLRKIVACSQSPSQCLLVSTVFGAVSSLHPTSFLHLLHTDRGEQGFKLQLNAHVDLSISIHD